MAKKIMKVPIGIPVLDDKFSGIYVGHVTLLTGASGEGREVAVGAALTRYYRMEEQVLAVFSESADHVALRAREVGYDLEKATEIGALSIIYHADKPDGELPVRESLEEIRDHMDALAKRKAPERKPFWVLFQNVEALRPDGARGSEQ